MTDLMTEIEAEYEAAMQPADFTTNDGQTDPQDAVGEPWKPRDENGVDWALLKRANAAKRIERIEEAKAAAIHELSALYDRRIAQEKSTFDFFDAVAKDALIELAEPGKGGKLSLKLAHGTIFAKTTQQWSYDDSRVIEWAKAHEMGDSLVTVKESLNKTAVKAYVKETGEAPEGVAVVPVTSIQILPA